MSSQRRKSHKRRRWLPRFSTVALVVVAGVAAWFYVEMNEVSDNLSEQQLVTLEQDLVKNRATQLLDAIDAAMSADSMALDKRAQWIKNTVDSSSLAALDTMLLRNDRYAHLRTAMEERVLLPRSGNDSVSYPDTLVALLEEYAQVEQLAIADSCLAISRQLSPAKK